MAGVASLAVGGGLVLGFKAAIQSANDHAKALALTEAGIKSTGGAANVTAKQIGDFANALEKKTGVDDLAIQSGQNMLLTFTAIRNEVGKGNDIFNQTSRAVTDMAVRMNNGSANAEQMSKTAILVGKALADPIKGLSALHRVGVEFTDGQKKAIETMVKAGDTMGAQKVILKELNKEFGGSAEAVGKTLPGQLNILKARLDDVAQKIGDKLIPALTSAVSWVSANWPQISAVFETVSNAVIGAVSFVVDAVRANWPQIKQIALEVFATVKGAIEAAIPTIRQIAAALVEFARQAFPIVVQAVQAFLTVWRAVWPTVQAVMTPIVQAIGPLLRGMADVIRGVVAIIKGIFSGDWSLVWSGFTKVVSGAVQIVRTLLEAAVRVLVAIAARIGAGILNAIKGALSGLGAWFAGLWSSMVGAITGAVGRIVAAATSVGRGILDGIVKPLVELNARVWAAIFGGISAAISAVASWVGGAASAIGSALIRGVINGVESMLGALKSKLGDIGNAIIGWKGPPEKDRVLLFPAGQMIMQGLIGGIESKRPALRASLVGVGSQLVAMIQQSLVAGGMKLTQAAGVALQTAMQVQPAILKAAETLGLAHAAAIARGVVQGAPSLATQMKQALSQAVQQAIQAAAQKVTAARSAFESAFGNVASAALAAFDAKVSAWVSPAQKLLDKMQLQDQIKQLNDAITAAQTGVGTAQAALDALNVPTMVSTDGGAAVLTPPDPTAVAKAQADLVAAQATADAAVRAKKEFDLGLQATDETTAHNKLMEQRRTQFGQQLTQLQTELLKHPAEYAKTQAKIIALLQKYIPDFKLSGSNLGYAIAQGIRDSIGAAVAAATELANAVRAALPSPGPGSPSAPPVPPINIPWLASGGPIKAGTLSVVGESGPELFMPSTSGRVIPNNALRSVGHTINNYFASAPDPLLWTRQLEFEYGAVAF